MQYAICVKKNYDNQNNLVSMEIEDFDQNRMCKSVDDIIKSMKNGELAVKGYMLESSPNAKNFGELMEISSGFEMSRGGFQYEYVELGYDASEVIDRQYGSGTGWEFPRRIPGRAWSNNSRNLRLAGSIFGWHIKAKHNAKKFKCNSVENGLPIILMEDTFNGYSNKEGVLCCKDIHTEYVVSFRCAFYAADLHEIDLRGMSCASAIYLADTFSRNRNEGRLNIIGMGEFLSTLNKSVSVMGIIEDSIFNMGRARSDCSDSITVDSLNVAKAANLGCVLQRAFEITIIKELSFKDFDEKVYIEQIYKRIKHKEPKMELEKAFKDATYALEMEITVNSFERVAADSIIEYLDLRGYKALEDKFVGRTREGENDNIAFNSLETACSGSEITIIDMRGSDIPLNRLLGMFARLNNFQVLILDSFDKQIRDNTSKIKDNEFLQGVYNSFMSSLGGVVKVDLKKFSIQEMLDRAKLTGGIADRIMVIEGK